jgi:exonuclease SbcC
MLAAREVEVARLTGRIAERESKSERVAAIAERAAMAEAARDRADRWAQLENAAEELAEAESALAELGYDENAADEMKARLEAGRAERTGLLEELEAVGTQLASAAARADALGERHEAGDASQHEAPLKQLRDESELLKSERAVLAAQLELDRAHIDEVREGGEDTPCPVCRKPYGPEYTQIVAGYEERLTTAETRLPVIDTRLKALGTEVISMERSVSRARAAAVQLAATIGADKLDAAEAERDRLHKRETEIRERIEKADAELSAFEAEAADLSKRGEAHGRKAAVRAERARVHLAACKALGIESYDTTAHAAATTTATELAALRAEHDRLLAEIGAAAGLETEIADVQDSVTASAAKVDECDNALTTLGFDAERAAALVTQRDAAKETCNEAQERFTQARLQAQAASQEVQTLRARRQEAESQRAEIARRQALLRQHTVAADLLTRYRDHQLQRAWPALETGASELLSATTDGRYADVRLSSDDYKLTIVDRGEAHGLERYSGGEQDLANLCLRLAIASWVAKERSAEVDFVVLDEVFGSQDEDRRRKVVAELRALGNRFRQVLVVTHLPDIADLCESQIDVELVEAGLSRALVVGQARNAEAASR